ncbi:MAG: methylmalonyl-CoA epimerase, partial [Candidatus Eremiobacteraeota bacterium]|nr:methylmalonyl-CoA epimerase [Candidatus Eremiobacteraeota bacterium]
RMKIDHVAIVVRDLEGTLAIYTGILGFNIAYREVIDEQSVEVIGLAAGDSSIELLRPLSEDSPIAAYRGSAATKLHHTAYRVDDLQAELARLKSAGIRLIDEEPRRGAHGNMIAFLHPKSTAGVLIELCQPADTMSTQSRSDVLE